MIQKPFPFTLERHFNVSAEKVFFALTNSEAISEWCGSEGKVSDLVGGDFEMFDGWVKGHVLVFEPNSALAYTWKPDDWEESDLESDVYYTLLPDRDGGTFVTLTHMGFPNQKESENHQLGWEDFVFKPLEDYFHGQ